MLKFGTPAHVDMLVSNLQRLARNACRICFRRPP